VGVSLDLYDVHFADEMNGWAVGRNSVIVHTTDGGQSWSTQPSGTANWLYGIHAHSPDEAVAVGLGGTVIRTLNGGQDWIPQTSTTLERLTSVYFVDSEYGWATGTGGTIIHTRDGGHNWERQETGTFGILDDIAFADRMAGWAVGDQGEVFVSEDGGETWTLQTTRTVNFLHGVAFADSWHGWTIGDNGSVFRTDDGGGTDVSRVQFVNGSVSSEYDPADIYVDGVRFVDDLGYREATAYMSLPTEFELGFTRGASVSLGPSDARFPVQHEAGRDYVIVLIGERVHPERPLAIVDLGASVATKSGADQPVAIVNAVLDAEPLDFHIGTELIADAVPFGQFTSTAAPPGQRVLHVTLDASGELVESFELAVGEASGSLIPIIATGYLEPPAGAEDRPFAMIAVDRAGGVVVPGLVTSIEPVSSQPDFEITPVFPNPVRSHADVKLTVDQAALVSVEIFDLLGRRVLAGEPQYRYPTDGRPLRLDARGLSSGLYLARVVAVSGRRRAERTVRF
ncbi:MAG: YCF48-related protein, partial [Rhodothermales bacterium]|nr:YCF48-related protein [Rhodothermales bacterium]